MSSCGCQASSQFPHASRRILFRLTIKDVVVPSLWTGLTWLSLAGLSRGLSGKEPACSRRNVGSIPGSGRSHGGGNGNPLQHSCLENPVARRAWWGTVHEVTNSQTRLSRHSELSTLSELWSEMILPAQCPIRLFSFPFFCSFIFLLLLLYPSFPCRQIGQ